MENLSEVQKQLLKLLQKNIDEPLSMRELQETLEISSTSVVHHHICQLEKKGYLRRNPSNPRDYQILSESPEKKVAYLNVYGYAKCGPNGTLLDGNPIDKIPISSRVLGFPAIEGFMVKAKGDSMEPYIYEGDYIIARKSQSFNENNVVVCIHNGEVKVKKICKHKNADGEQILLISHNSSKYPPEIVSSKEDLRIVGIVSGVLSFNNFS